VVCKRVSTRADDGVTVVTRRPAGPAATRMVCSRLQVVVLPSVPVIPTTVIVTSGETLPSRRQVRPVPRASGDDDEGAARLPPVARDHGHGASGTPGEYNVPIGRHAA